MIIVSSLELKIGSIINSNGKGGIYHPEHKKYYDKPFMVLKEVTLEDYLTQCREWEMILNESLVYHKLISDRYYLISVD